MSNTNNQIATQAPSSPESLNRKAQPPDFPSPPMVKPSDEAVRILRLFKPKRNKTGTDKSKPPTIKGNKVPDGVKPVPEVPLEKISLPALAGFTAG